MPPLALANDLWGGRLHPLYRELNLATQAALSPGRAMIRLFLLRERGEDKETVQKGFSGNIVLLAQPSSTQILKALPPNEQEMQHCFSVLYNTSREDVGKQPGFVIVRQQYIECAELRRKVCPCFDEIQIDRERAAAELSQNAVPSDVLQSAIQMSSLDEFAPNLLWLHIANMKRTKTWTSSAMALLMQTMLKPLLRVSMQDHAKASCQMKALPQRC